MKYRDEIHIALMALVFSCAMFAVYAVVPKDAAVAARAKATVKEAPETAAEAEALRSSQDEDAGFNIYTEDNNYDDSSDSSDSTDSSDSSASSDQATYDPGTDYSGDTSDGDVADEGSSDQGDYDSSDQIDYPSDDGSEDTSTDNSYDDSSQDSGDSSTDTSGSDTSDTTDTAPFDIATEDSNY